MEEVIKDGYGVRFDPVKHAAYVRAGTKKCEQEQEEVRKNTPPLTEPEWKSLPAGHHNKGKGV